MLGESNFYPQVARLIEEACESAYLNSLRAAAVTLRVSAQLFVGAEVFGKDPNSPDLPRVRKMIQQLDGSHPPVTFSTGRKRTIVDSLTFVARLGDTAAHPSVDATWRLLPLPSNVADGITAIENLIAAAKGWAL